ncbi:MAG: uracil-xanthine permease [Bacilli bacterium]|nr:uracil-xanthine permease [Bacilli bacterium]
MKEKRMMYDINEQPPLGKWIVLALQHVFAMFGATILVPILVNAAAGETVLTIPVALVTSGIGTLIYILCTKGKSPVYLGSSFAFITPIAAAYLKGGISGAMTGVMAVGIVYIIVALVIKLVGKNWLDKILPPVVIGPMIMIIGLGLAPSAISQIGLSGTQFDWKILIVALVSFIVTAVVMTRAKGFLKIIPFLVGIVSGYIVAVCLGMIDFTPVKDASWFSIPAFVIPFKDYALNFGALVTILPIALVTLCEHIGDHTSLSNIIGKDLIKDPGLDRTLLGDGIATFVAGALGGPANTTYGENTSVVGMTKVASVKVIGLAAIFAIIIGFLGKFTSLVGTIPNPVLGGVSLLLYGFIAVNGLKVLIKNQVNFEDSKNVVVASSMLVLGLGGAAISIISGDFSLTISGMSLASIVGIILNLCLPNDRDALVVEVDSKKISTPKVDVEVKVTKKVPAKKTTSKKSSTKKTTSTSKKTTAKKTSKSSTKKAKK